jgi:hypothetical protein
VCALQALEGSMLSASQVDALLLDLGLVLRHISSSSTGSSAAAGMGHAAIAEKARRLIAFACDQGWVAVASAVLPLASACGTCAHDIVAAIHNSTAQVGWALCTFGWVLHQQKCCCGPRSAICSQPLDGRRSRSSPTLLRNCNTSAESCGCWIGVLMHH